MQLRYFRALTTIFSPLLYKGVAESLFEAASAISTVGLSVSVTAPDAPSTLLWTEIVAMFLGRLEFLTVFVGLIRIVRDLRPALKG